MNAARVGHAERGICHGIDKRLDHIDIDLINKRTTKRPVLSARPVRGSRPSTARRENTARLFYSESGRVDNSPPLSALSLSLSLPLRGAASLYQVTLEISVPGARWRQMNWAFKSSMPGALIAHSAAERRAAAAINDVPRFADVRSRRPTTPPASSRGYLFLRRCLTGLSVICCLCCFCLNPAPPRVIYLYKHLHAHIDVRPCVYTRARVRVCTVIG